MGILDLPGPQFLLLFLGLIGGISLAAVKLRQAVRPPNGNLDVRMLRLDPVEVAYLAGGERRAADSVFASLAQRELLTVSLDSRIALAKGTAPADIGPHEHWLHSFLTAEPATVDDIRTRFAPRLSLIGEKLQDLGLLIRPDRAWVSSALPVALLASLLAFGIAKVAIGLARERPVGLLLVLLGVVAIEIWAFIKNPPRLSQLGDNALEALRIRNSALATTASTEPTRVAPSDMALAVGLFGPALVTSGPVAALANPNSPSDRSRKDQSGSCGGSSSGCGGSGCGGGGGGGCGGCGG